VRESPPTAGEQCFFDLLVDRVAGLLASRVTSPLVVADLQDWYHADEDGTPWMTVSHDFVRDGAVTATLRCDYDGTRLLGGWSPALLNWDDGVRALDAGVVTAPPDGLDARVSDPGTAAAVAAAWFASHVGAKPSAAAGRDGRDR
jgi:hypothetical protein